VLKRNRGDAVAEPSNTYFKFDVASLVDSRLSTVDIPGVLVIATTPAVGLGIHVGPEERRSFRQHGIRCWVPSRGPEWHSLPVRYSF